MKSSSIRPVGVVRDRDGELRRTRSLAALGKIKKGADKAADAKKKYDDMHITEKEERQLGEQVSLKLREQLRRRSRTRR